MIFSIRHKVLLFGLVSVLAAPLMASAAGPRPEVHRVVQAAELTASELFNRIWDFFQTAGLKEGCGIDPFGRCENALDQNRVVQPKEGCHIDPFGRCVKSLAQFQLPALQPKEGCHIDPNGRCLP